MTLALSFFLASVNLFAGNTPEWVEDLREASSGLPLGDVKTVGNFVKHKMGTNALIDVDEEVASGIDGYVDYVVENTIAYEGYVPQISSGQCGCVSRVLASYYGVEAYEDAGVTVIGFLDTKIPNATNHTQVLLRVAGETEGGDIINTYWVADQYGVREFNSYVNSKSTSHEFRINRPTSPNSANPQSDWMGRNTFLEKTNLDNMRKYQMPSSVQDKAFETGGKLQEAISNSVNQYRDTGETNALKLRKALWVRTREAAGKPPKPVTGC